MSSNTKESSSKKSAPKKDKIGTGATIKPETTPKKEGANKKSTSKVEKGKSVASVKKAPTKRKRGRFTEADEKDIVKMYKSKAKYSEIAAKYNSPQSSIYMVLVRQQASIPQPRKKK